MNNEDNRFWRRRRHRQAPGARLLDATMIVVGSMIGSGIFIVSAESSRLISAPAGCSFTWLVAVVLTITGALCRGAGRHCVACRRALAFFSPRTYWPATGFLYGWAVFLVIQTGTIAAVAVVSQNFSASSHRRSRTDKSSPRRRSGGGCHAGALRPSTVSRCCSFSY